MFFVSIIIDPPTKSHSLDFWFKEVLDAEKATHMITKLRRQIDKLYDHYNNSGGNSSRSKW